MATLAQKAWKSAAFKEQLVKDPAATIKEVTGYTFAENVKVVIEDQTDESVIYLNIPRKVDYNNFELTDEQLELVAGGEAVGLILIGLFAAGLSIGLAIN